MQSRYIENDFSPLLTVDDPKRHFEESLEGIIAKLPPREHYQGEKLPLDSHTSSSTCLACIRNWKSQATMLSPGHPDTWTAQGITCLSIPDDVV